MKTIRTKIETMEKIIEFPKSIELVEAGCCFTLEDRDEVCVEELESKKEWGEGDGINMWGVRGRGRIDGKKGSFSFDILLNFSFRRGYLVSGILED